MASDAYIAAAKLANRQPTTYMSVESAEGETLYYTTQGQWTGSDTLTDLSFDGSQADVGDIIQKNYSQTVIENFGLWHNDLGTSSALEFTAGYDQYLNQVNIPMIWFQGADGTRVNTRVKLTNTNPLTTTPTITHYSDEVTVEASSINSNISLYDGLFDARTVGHKILSGETWFVQIEMFFISGGAFPTGWAQSQTFSATPPSLMSPSNFPLYSSVTFSVDTVKPTSQLITSAIDFGAVTASNPIFSVDDITDAGALIAYSYTYSTDDITYVSGGTIVDGSSLVASRYFKIQADFTTTTGGRGKIREIQLKEGIFRYFGSHIDTPFAGVSPQIIPNSVSTLSQKIQIGKGLSTTGESSVRMFWVQEVSDMIASGYLKGKDVAIYSGFVGLPTDAYEPILVGTWYDHTLDEINRVITVKIRDAFKQFEKRKIPEEVVNPSTGAITTPPLTFTTTSLVTVMKQIFDEIGLRDRYISPDFDTLEAGDYAAAKYKVSRSLVKFSTPSIGNPTDFNKLLDELAVSGSMYLVPQGNGQIKPKPFNPNIEHTATLDANEIDFVNLKGNISEFFSRFYAYYNPKTTLTADPTDDTDDYDNGTAVIDATAEVNWFPERGTKQHFDKWKVGRTAAATPLTAPPQALTDLMDLWNSLFTEPLYTVSAKKIPPRFANIEPADVIEVDNLDLPVVDNAWVTSASYSGKSIALSEGSAALEDIFLSEDGSKMYTLSGGASDSIFQYSLSTLFDINTAIYDTVSFDLSTQISAPVGMFFRDDGLKFYVIGLNDQAIFQYSLSPAWDLSTASYDSKTFDLSTDAALPNDVYFKTDGSVMFVVDDSSNSIRQFDLSTDWDVSTAVYNSVTKSVSSETTGPNGVFFSLTGNRMFVSDASIIYQYDLSVDWDVSSATYSGANIDISVEAVSEGIAFSKDGLNVYSISDAANAAYQYTIPEAWELAANTYTEGDRVIHDGFMWRARQDNSGKDPTSEAAFWQNTQISDAGITVGKHFFVLGRKFNPNQATMGLDLMEMPPGTLGGFDSGFSSGFNL